jgi:hypothetical protein
VHAELRLGQGLRCGRKRVERLMRSAGLQGIYRRRRQGCTVRDPAATPHPDLVNRQFTADRPDRLWVTDITQHRTGQGWLYFAVVRDVYSRRVLGWSIADHLRTELVIDAWTWPAGAASLLPKARYCKPITAASTARTAPLRHYVTCNVTQGVYLIYFMTSGITQFFTTE